MDPLSSVTNLFWKHSLNVRMIKQGGSNGSFQHHVRPLPVSAVR